VCSFRVLGSRGTIYERTDAGQLGGRRQGRGISATGGTNALVFGCWLVRIWLMRQSVSFPGGLRFTRRANRGGVGRHTFRHLFRYIPSPPPRAAAAVVVSAVVGIG